MVQSASIVAPGASTQPRTSVIIPTQTVIRQPIAAHRPRGTARRRPTTRADTPPNRIAEDERDRGQPEPLEPRARLARPRAVASVASSDAASARPASPGPGSGRSRPGPEVRRHEVAGDRRGHLGAAAGLLDEDGDRDPRCLGRGEPDEPRVRLARAAQLGRAGLAGGGHAGDLRPGGELPAERRPRPPGPSRA